MSHVKSSLIKESEGALPGIGLASKIWNTSKNVIAIGGRLYNLDDAKNRLLKMKLPADEFDKRYNALMALESSYWMYMVRRFIHLSSSRWSVRLLILLLDLQRHIFIRTWVTGMTNSLE